MKGHFHFTNSEMKRKKKYFKISFILQWLRIHDAVIKFIIIPFRQNKIINNVVLSFSLKRAPLIKILVIKKLSEKFSRIQIKIPMAFF